MSLLDPIKHALAAVLATTHDALTALGASADSAATWVLGIASLVVLVRLALLPFVIHGVRQAHAAARARPHLQGITERYRGRTDAESLRAHMEERRAVSAEHGVSRLGCLPVLIQLPVWLGLYHLVSDVASGVAVSLAGHGYLGSGGVHLAVVAGLAVTAAGLSYVTQRFVVASNTSTEGMPEAMVAATRLMPVMSAGGLLLAGGVVPVALLVYWVCSSTWTLGQSAVVARWWPTPGTAAAARRLTA
jgi:YidC/Oxa1 family membrane protein insertase